jgi:ATP-binding cassette subfamily B protein
MSSRDGLPPRCPRWRALKRGYEAEPLLLVVAFGLCVLTALPVRFWLNGSSSSLTA